MISIILDRSSLFPAKSISNVRCQFNGEQKEMISEKGRQRNWPIRKVSPSSMSFHSQTFSPYWEIQDNWLAAQTEDDDEEEEKLLDQYVLLFIANNKRCSKLFPTCFLFELHWNVHSQIISNANWKCWMKYPMEWSREQRESYEQKEYSAQVWFVAFWTFIKFPLKFFFSSQL